MIEEDLLAGKCQRLVGDIHLHTRERTGWRQFAGIRADLRPVLLINGLHEIVIVISCDPELIPPGTSGEAEHHTVDRYAERAGARIGDTFPVMGGAVEIGEFTVRAIENIIYSTGDGGTWSWRVDIA